MSDIRRRNIRPVGAVPIRILYAPLAYAVEAMLAASRLADNWLQATDLAEALVEWMGKGGFPPTLTGKTNFDRIVVNAACQAIACWEIA